jgi:hypothetical protein
MGVVLVAQLAGAYWAPVEVSRNPPGAGWLPDIDVREIVWVATRFPMFRPMFRAAPGARYGRPQAASEAAQSVALLHDAAGLAQNELVQFLYGLEPIAEQRDSTADAARKQIRRDLTTGRAWRCDQGVLPWAIYEHGKLPQRWWADDLFCIAIRSWFQHEEAIKQSLARL